MLEVEGEVKRVRIATIGWKNIDKAETADEVVTSYRIPWVEFIDDDVTIRVPGSFFNGVDIRFRGDEFTHTTIEFVVTPEIVFVDSNGEELP